MKKILYLALICWTFIACNKPIEEPTEENYEDLFGIAPIPPPSYEDNILMPKLPCEANITEEEYIYPGKDIEQKKKYLVTLRFWFKEIRIKNASISTVQSDVDLRYIDKNKKLVTLTTLHEKDFTSDQPYELTFEAYSGFPLYLGIYGAGFDNFEMKASLQATTEDGLIATPEISYHQKLYADGHTDDFNFCEKIILP